MHGLELLLLTIIREPDEMQLLIHIKLQQSLHLQQLQQSLPLQYPLLQLPLELTMTIAASVCGSN